MLKSIMLSAIALCVLAAPASAQQKEEFLGQHLRQHFDDAERLAAAGKLSLGLPRIVYDDEGNKCLGLVGWNTTAECTGAYDSKTLGRVHGLFYLYDKPPVADTASATKKPR